MDSPSKESGTAPDSFYFIPLHRMSISQTHFIPREEQELSCLFYSFYYSNGEEWTDSASSEILDRPKLFWRDTRILFKEMRQIGLVRKMQLLSYFCYR